MIQFRLFATGLQLDLNSLSQALLIALLCHIFPFSVTRSLNFYSPIILSTEQTLHNYGSSRSNTPIHVCLGSFSLHHTSYIQPAGPQSRYLTPNESNCHVSAATMPSQRSPLSPLPFMSRLSWH
jgi:hypothetical protein